MSRRVYFPLILFVLALVLALSVVSVDARPSSVVRNAPIVIDHRHTDISKIPVYWINQARDMLRLSYGHTSHGSQVVSGMETIKLLYPAYDFNTDGAITPGVLSLADYTPGGDLGNPDRVTWASLTDAYLTGPTGTGPSRNVTVWSWCGEVSYASEADINTYTSLMSQLETAHPTVNFVYMTGHLDGSGENGTLHIRNQQIRDYAIANNKVLFDFADIESYDPAGNYYPDESDACSWCTTWCDSHPGDCANIPSDCAHSHGFNCLRKAQAFWWLLARLAGWPGPDATPVTISGSAGVAGVTLSYTDGTAKTATSDASGNYSFTVASNWTGTVTPSKAGLTFLPSVRSYTGLLTDQVGQNFAPQVSISGNAGVAAAVLSYKDLTTKTVTADGSGNYTLTVPYNWSGTVTPSLSGKLFTPASLTYANLQANQTGQNYVASNGYSISGNVGLAGITLKFSDGGPKTSISDASGNYLLTVSSGWAGTITPAKSGYVFTPTQRSYAASPVTSNLVNQNFTAAPKVTFNDVPQTHWAWIQIETVYANGITSGCGTSPLIYCPDAIVTRAQMAVFLVHAIHGLGYKPPTATGTVFTDVPATSFAAAFIEQLRADGITSGCSTNTFCPDGTVTRAQLAVFLLRGKHGSTYAPPAASGVFSDVPVTYWAAAWVEQLAAEGITSGCGSGAFCPDIPVTRAQMAVLLTKAFSLQ